MKKFKGTQKDWQQKQFKNSVIVNSQDLVEQTIICQVYGNGGEAEANAKLIAASKDLLEALQYAMNNCTTVSASEITLPREFKTIALNALNKVLN